MTDTQAQPGTDEALAYIVDKAHQRRERWVHKELYRLPALDTLRESTIVGSFSFCLQSSRQRLLKLPDCIGVDHVVETPTAIARDYAMFEYKRGPRARHTQMDCIRDGMRAVPNFVLPCSFEQGYYVDIRACYWSIMCVVGWNVDYWPEKWLARGKPPLRFPFPDHKLARNCLASVGLSDKLPIYSPDTQEIVGIKRGNPLSNLSLMRVITDVLQSIAGQALELGAVYANNDGFIVPDDKSLDAVSNLIAEWGLTARIKYEGAGAVHSSGAFAVGKHKSGLTDLRKEDSIVLGVRAPRYASWLRKAFTFWAAKPA